ncbi:hypothetical protein [Crateriforma spongiae]|uniref:hypothetical protein n=1 Tax=Crateriforma spongiae TaxID=2724528 RepID=UPI0019812082
MLDIQLFAIKDVHGQRSIDLDRIGAFLFIKEHSSTESTNARLAGLMQYRIGPDRHHDFGSHGLVFVRPFPVGLYRCTAADHP